MDGGRRAVMVTGLVLIALGVLFLGIELLRGGPDSPGQTTRSVPTPMGPLTITTPYAGLVVMVLGVALLLAAYLGGRARR